MKKYRNFLIIIIFSGILGGFVGYLSESNINLTINLDTKSHIYLFNSFLGIEILLSLLIICSLVFLKVKFNSIDINYIPQHIDKILQLSIHFSSVAVIMSLTFFSVMISKSFKMNESNYFIIPFITMIVTTILQIICINLFNIYYPNRQLNMFENNANKKYFEKLDEGEKFITYSCSYKSFKGMQFVYSLALIIVMMLSSLITIPIILPITIAIFWIIHISIYTIETLKYS